MPLYPYICLHSRCLTMLISLTCPAQETVLTPFNWIFDAGLYCYVLGTCLFPPPFLHPSFPSQNKRGTSLTGYPRSLKSRWGFSLTCPQSRLAWVPMPPTNQQPQALASSPPSPSTRTTHVQQLELYFPSEIVSSLRTMIEPFIFFSFY